MRVKANSVFKLENSELNGNSFILAGSSDAGVLLFHGFTATTVEVRPLAEYLNANQYSVAAPLLPGHGSAPEQALKVTRKEWLKTAEDEFTELKMKTSKIVVAGESMGALLALHLAFVHPEIAGILLYAPAVHIAGQWRAPLLAPFIKVRPKPYLQEKEHASDPEELPWQGYSVLPIPAVAQFYWLQRQVRKELPNIRQPALIFQGKLDRTINPSGAGRVLDGLGSIDKSLVWLEKSGHTVLLGTEHQEVYRRSLEFIERVTG
jgi:carboxylesterase